MEETDAFSAQDWEKGEEFDQTTCEDQFEGNHMAEYEGGSSMNSSIASLDEQSLINHSDAQLNYETTLNGFNTQYCDARVNNEQSELFYPVGAVEQSFETELNGFDAQYCNADVNNEQLAVLCEVRSREVSNLQKQIIEMNKLQQETTKQMDRLKFENESKDITLKEQDSLLAGKVEQIQTLQDELKSFRMLMEKLETNIKEISEEKTILQELNLDYEKKFAMMDKGFPLLQNKIDKETIETQKSKILELENSLDKALEQIDLKDAKIRKMNRIIEETGNRLRDSEFTIKELSMKLEIKEKNEAKENLCKSGRQFAVEEFQDKITLLNKENITLKEAMHVQEDRFVKKENDLKVLQNDYENLIKKIESMNYENDALKNKLAVSETRINQIDRKNQILQEKLVVSHSRAEIEQAVQTSFISNDEESKTKLALEKAYSKIKKLEDENKALEKKKFELQNFVDLNQQYHITVKELQAKAVEFEKKIYAMQKIQSVSIGVNTETIQKGDDNSLLQMNKLQQECSSCSNCEDLNEQIKSMREDRAKDKITVLTAIKVWEQKFREAGIKHETELASLKDVYYRKYENKRIELLSNLKVFDAGSKEIEKKLSKLQANPVKKKCDDEILDVEKRYLQKQKILEKRMGPSSGS